METPVLQANHLNPYRTVKKTGRLGQIPGLPVSLSFTGLDYAIAAATNARMA